jgi:hypothetical protein
MSEGGEPSFFFIKIKHTQLLFKKESITKRSPTAQDKLIIA